MRWQTKINKPYIYKKNKVVIVSRFAFLPVKCNTGTTSWLEYVYYHYKALKDTTISPPYDQIDYQYGPTMDSQCPYAEKYKTVTTVWKLIQILN